MKSSGLHLYAGFVAIATLLVIVTGAYVSAHETGPAGGHRAVTACAGVLILGLVGWVLMAEKQHWLRRLGWIALAGVAAECGLGVWASPASPMTCMAHAFLAPLLLAAVVAIVLGTSGSWHRQP